MYLTINYAITCCTNKIQNDFKSARSDGWTLLDDIYAYFFVLSVIYMTFFVIFGHFIGNGPAKLKCIAEHFDKTTTTPAKVFI
jgi:hypothetical protein